MDRFVTILLFALAAVNCDAQNNLIDGVNKFTMEFYKELKKILSDDFMISPSSTHTILSLMSLAAEGPSRAELNKALNLNDPTTIESDYKTAIAYLKAIQNIKLYNANKLYMEYHPDYSLIGSFVNKAKNVFSSEIENLSFSSPTAAVDTINDWIKLNTGYNVRNSIAPGDLTGVRAGALVNVPVFEGKWKYKFSDVYTNYIPFNTAEGPIRSVQTMWQVNTFNYAYVQDWNAKILEMPFENEDVTMLFFLPDTNLGFDSMENNILNSNLNDKLATMSVQNVVVSLPTFYIFTKIDLKTLLPSLEINMIFDENDAALGNLVNYFVKFPKQKAHINAAIQANVMSLNEHGVYGSHSTGIDTPPALTSPAHVVHFAANYPFVFMIKAKNGQILFIGRYLGPKQVFPINNSINNLNDIWNKNGMGRPDLRHPKYRPRTIRGVIYGYEIV